MGMPNERTTAARPIKPPTSPIYLSPFNLESLKFGPQESVCSVKAPLYREERIGLEKSSGNFAGIARAHSPFSRARKSPETFPAGGVGRKGKISLASQAQESWGAACCAPRLSAGDGGLLTGLRRLACFGRWPRLGSGWANPRARGRGERLRRIRCLRRNGFRRCSLGVRYAQSSPCPRKRVRRGRRR